MSDTSSRKQEHIEICVGAQVACRNKRTGFEEWDYVHNALPEINVADIDTSTEFLGYTLSFPLLISGMTGGYADAVRINGILSEVSQELRVAIGTGSMRQALEDNRFHESWKIVRRNAPDVPVLANIGAPEVARMRDTVDAERLLELVAADALVVHTNPLQEFLQPEGDTGFSGVLKALQMLCTRLSVPVILKEAGAGISVDTARRAYEAGVRYIDVSGAGGTSWAGVEMLRRNNDIEIAPAFHDWGIPTVEALLGLRSDIPEDLRLIASGGITDGLALAKCLTLGAILAGAARPLLTAVFEGGREALRKRILSWKHDLTGAMFLTGCRTVNDLHHAPLIHRLRL